MNKLILLGRVSSDINYTQTANSSVARFNFAVNRRFAKTEDEVKADFFNCVAFGKTSETLCNYVTKGTKLLLDAELRNNNYTDNSGVKHYSNQVIVNSFEFAESKGSQDAQEAQGTQGAGGFMDIPDNVDDSGLPFN